MRPLISIIVPVYNVEKYLSDCLDSILIQSFHDYEIVCINDGSTDNSLQIINEYKKREKEKIKIINQSNQGLSVARNSGIKEAKGKYICFLDSDDMLEDNALEIMMEYIGKHPNVNIFQFEIAPLLFQTGMVDENKIRYYSIGSTYPNVMEGKTLFAKLMKNNDFVESANILLIDRDWLVERRICFTPRALYEDSIFSIDCFMQAKKVLHISEPIYIYRIRENSIMTSKYTFNQMRWRIWQYKELLRRLFSYELDSDVEYALSKYAEMVLGSLKEVYINLSDNEALKISELESVEGLLAHSFNMGIDNVFGDKLRYQGLLKILEEADSIVIYGAGNVGNKIFSVAKKLRIENKILGYATSVKTEIEKLNDLYVKTIGEYNNEKIGVIIIASIRNHYEMLGEAKKLNAKEICVIDAALEKMMDEWMKQQL